MAEKPVKRKTGSKPKRQKVKQGHKLVWITLVIILLPLLVVGYVLLTSAKESNQPVEGNRFGPNDLNPKITEAQMNSIQSDLMNIGGVETATVDLKSATLRLHINMVDQAGDENLQAAANQAYDIVNNYLPIETYFTNPADGKNYDLEIDAYNYLVDDAHPQEGWHFVKISKSGAGQKVTDIITTPRNPELAADVKNQQPVTPGAADPQAASEAGAGEGQEDIAEQIIQEDNQ